MAPSDGDFDVIQLTNDDFGRVMSNLLVYRNMFLSHIGNSLKVL